MGRSSDDRVAATTWSESIRTSLAPDAFKYDPFGRRIYKSSSSGTSVFAYDGDNLVEETNWSGAVVARYEDTQNIDEPLAMLRSSATSYYEADGLGSITSLTNSSGAAAETLTEPSFCTTANGPFSATFCACPYQKVRSCCTHRRQAAKSRACGPHIFCLT